MGRGVPTSLHHHNMGYDWFGDPWTPSFSLWLFLFFFSLTEDLLQIKEFLTV